MKRTDIKIGDEYAVTPWDSGRNEFSSVRVRAIVVGFEQRVTRTGYGAARSHRKLTFVKVKYVSATQSFPELVKTGSVRRTWAEEEVRRKEVVEYRAASDALTLRKGEATDRLVSALEALSGDLVSELLLRRLGFSSLTESEVERVEATPYIVGEKVKF